MGNCIKLKFEAEQEFQQWLHHIPKASRDIVLPKVDFTLTTDASELGCITAVILRL